MTWAQNPAAYVLYDKDGKRVEYAKMMEDMGQKELVFLGEIHNCPIAHWMEKVIIGDLYKLHGDKLILGAEMFERDNQLLLNEYLGGLIPESRFKAEAKLWDNYDTDYAPLVEFAKQNNLPFIATNVARRYANMVAKGGYEALDKVSEEAQEYIAPLPIKYLENPLVNAYFAHMMQPGMSKAPTENLAKAQTVKDATMAWSIAQSLKEYMVHINGSFHSTGHAGIINYLNVYRPGLKIGTIEVVQQDSVEELDTMYKGHADYFICVPAFEFILQKVGIESMTVFSCWRYLYIKCYEKTV